MKPFPQELIQPEHRHLFDEDGYPLGDDTNEPTIPQEE